MDKNPYRSPSPPPPKLYRVRFRDPETQAIQILCIEAGDIDTATDAGMASVGDGWEWYDTELVEDA